jgi:hypothetical protein
MKEVAQENHVPLAMRVAETKQSIRTYPLQRSRGFECSATNVLLSKIGPEN